jgi:hypothetical protein
MILSKFNEIFEIFEIMLSGCELTDTENISLPSQNMKFGGE